MFKDLALLVEQQGEMLNNIEKNVEQVSNVYQLFPYMVFSIYDMFHIYYIVSYRHGCIKC